MIISKPGSNSAPREVAADGSDFEGIELAAEPSIAQALARLYQASFLASDCGRSTVDFAVSVAELRLAGISSPALRWLVEKQLAAHWILPSSDATSRALQEAADQTWLSEQSWLCLSETGLRLAVGLIQEGRLQDTPPHNGESETASHMSRIPVSHPQGEWQVGGEQTPSWDPERHELRCGRLLIKKFKWRASNQERILAVFEEEGWPARIDDPLPPRPEIDSKRRLGDTIKCLNRNHLVQVLKFIGDGSGQGVIWEFQPDLPRKSK